MKKVLDFLFSQEVLGKLKPYFLGINPQVVDRRLPYPSEEWKQATIRAAAVCRDLVKRYPALRRTFNDLDRAYCWREYDSIHALQSYFEYAMSLAIFLAWTAFTKKAAIPRELMRCAFLQHVGKYLVLDIPMFLREHPLLSGLMKPLENELSRDALCTIDTRLYLETVLNRRNQGQFDLAQLYLRLLYVTKRVFISGNQKLVLALLEIERCPDMSIRAKEFFGHSSAEGLLKPFRGSIAQTVKRAYAAHKDAPPRIITKEQMFALSSASAALTEAYCRQVHPTRKGKK